MSLARFALDDARASDAPATTYPPIAAPRRVRLAHSFADAWIGAWPLRGGPWLARQVIGRVLPRLPAPSVCPTLLGFDLVVGPGDGNYYHLGAYERGTLQVIAACLRPGDVFVDIGASIGQMALHASTRVGPAGRVLAIEPDPRVADLLERNLSLNGMTQVEVVQCAAGADRAMCCLEGYADGAENRGVSRIRQDGAVPLGMRFPVHTMPIDALLDERGVPDVDLIKIDVEGFEAEVLDGMAEGLAAQRYRRIVVELHPALLAERGTTADACCARLRASGYAGWAFDHSPAAVRRAAYSRSLSLATLLTRSDVAPAEDPWPHMLWTATEAPLPSHG